MSETERKNIIVVGAGASQEFGLPTGAELTKKLKQNLGFSIDEFGHVERGSASGSLQSALQQYSAQNRLYSHQTFQMAKKISENMELAPSIDNFLDTHKSNEHLVGVGKTAIAHAIMEAERLSLLRIDEANIYNRLNFSKVENSWAAVFFKLIAAKRNYANFLGALANITFVSFNYDRCIKQFFVNAAASYFDLEQSQVEEVSNAIEVIHPYGSIGDLRVLNGRTQNFGLEPFPDRVLAAADNIQTFTEGVSDASLTAAIGMAFTEAELIIFLGFSFIDINMEILTPSQPVKSKVGRILATAKGRSMDTKSRISDELARTYMYRAQTDGVEMFDGKCFELFWEYDHYLTSAQSV